MPGKTWADFRGSGGGVRLLRDYYRTYMTPFQWAVFESGWSKRKTAIASGHGFGKSFALARLILAWGLVYPDGLTVLTAPTARQTKHVIWGGLRKAAEEMSSRVIEGPQGPVRATLPVEVLQREMKIRGRVSAMHYTSAPGEAVSFQGIHAPRMLLVVDEAGGVDDRIFDAVETLGTGEHCHLIYLGNPTNPGRFKEACESVIWSVFRASCFEHPNVIEGREVIPGAVTRQWISDAWTGHCSNEPICWPRGKGLPADLDSRLMAHRDPWWMGHVLGLFPPEDEHSIVPWSSVAKARTLGDRPPKGCVLTMGVDVARYGADKFTLMVCGGGRLLHAESHPRTSGPEGVRLIRATARAWGVRPHNVRIDAGGMGGMGVVDWLPEDASLSPVERQWWAQCRGVEFGGKPVSREGQFLNRRAELYWNVRQRMERGELGTGTCDDPRELAILEAELRVPRFGYKAGGKIFVEPKEDIRKRLGASPDRADAFVLAAWPSRDMPDPPAIGEDATIKDKLLRSLAVAHGAGVLPMVSEDDLSPLGDATDDYLGGKRKDEKKEDGEAPVMGALL